MQGEPRVSLRSSMSLVKVEQGELRGAVQETVDGDSYIIFKGIPFAAPPVGDLRFKDPQPPKRWNGVRDALKEGPNCAQINKASKQATGEDDCLYLNVATTSLSASRPVMVWIHGGAFAMGSGDTDGFSPDYLINKDIVFVSINYRVGCLGFLNLDHEEASGNQGLKDQVAALRWVKENIAVFGGDPNNVTIFGESAGGASVHYLTLSPLAKGLFHKAISQSDSAIGPRAGLKNPAAMGYRLAAALGKETSDPYEAASFLRTVSPLKLIEAQESLLSPLEKLVSHCPFGPTLDDKSPHPFLPRPEAQLAPQGVDVPYMIGFNSHEGILFLMGIQDETYEMIDKHFEAFVPPVLMAKAPAKVTVIAQEIKKLYFGDEPITKEQRDNYVQWSGDLNFVNGVQQLAEYQSQKQTPTYLYRFSFGSKLSQIKSLLKIDVNGTSHGDELSYLFHAPKFSGNKGLKPGTPERIVMERFTRMWTDFAKTGDPTPKVDDVVTARWQPVTSSTKNYLEIDENLRAGVSPGEERWSGWKRIHATADE